ncbi:MAG: CocE/NonD family hydrolase [Ktedonobacterales bacterium]
MIRRKRNILEMAVATAIFGACAAGAMPVSHAAQATNPANDNGTPATAQSSQPDQNSKKQVANENKLQEVVISGYVSSLQNAVAVQKNSDSIVEAVSAQQIGLLPGTSIADALGRLPGLSTQMVNGRPQQLSIHGMSSDFISTLFDGNIQPSTANNNGVQLDQYPQSWVNTAKVYLTPSADLINAGLAGTVDLQTLRPLSVSHPIVGINANYQFIEPHQMMPGPGVSDKGHNVNGLFADQFFDHTLKGATNLLDVMAPVKYFMMGTNVWKTATTWPPEEATAQQWYLGSAGHANTLNGDGVLSLAPQLQQPADSYVYDPAAPVPTLGGAHQLPAFMRRGPVDQRPVEQRGDVLVYTSAPLDTAVSVAGPITVTLFAATGAGDTDFVARLVDVFPDGRAIPLTDGVVRLSLREAIDTPSPVEPGQVYRVEIDLWSTANTFLAGHRIRLDVTSSNFPRWERNLNTGQDSARSTEMRAAQQRVLHDGDHPSHVTLPVLPATA